MMDRQTDATKCIMSLLRLSYVVNNKKLSEQLGEIHTSLFLRIMVRNSHHGGVYHENLTLRYMIKTRHF